MDEIVFPVLKPEPMKEELKELDTLLLTLRLSLGKLRAALERAFTPIANLVLPPINRAIHAVIGFADDAAAVLAELFGFTRRSADKTLKSTAGAMKRTLASFDKLERLAGGSGSAVVTIPGEVLKLPERLKPLVEKLRALLRPLQELDFSAAEVAFNKLRLAMGSITRGLTAALEWVWFQVLAPMAQWGTEQALPVFLELLASVFRVLGSVLSVVQPLLKWLWNDLLIPMGQWTAQQLLTALGFLNQKLVELADWISGGRVLMEGFVGVLEQVRQAVASVCGQMDLWNVVCSAFRGGLQGVNSLAEGLKTAFNGVSGALASLRGNLTNLFSGLVPGFRTTANTALGVLNKAIDAAESGVNSMVRILNSFSVSVPSWVPGIGGKTFGINARTVSLPNIPYLAKGAVLPANKPFLAMVGDQRHGTNIEAPLSLIQDAVAEVLGANLAGQDAQTALLRHILAAIEGISVGDEVIGRAARRYEDRMAVLGGVL